ncbi:MAG TPA: hypothetical protein VLI05_01050 [Candidatus Saccharimonadia bacterium]|nr:hypothetical protein [Candidatus Saccharimonadia bacterium]
MTELLYALVSPAGRICPGFWTIGFDVRRPLKLDQAEQLRRVARQSEGADLAPIRWYGLGPGATQPMIMANSAMTEQGARELVRLVAEALGRSAEIMVLPLTDTAVYVQYSPARESCERVAIRLPTQALLTPYQLRTLRGFLGYDLRAFEALNSAGKTDNDEPILLYLISRPDVWGHAVLLPFGRLEEVIQRWAKLFGLQLEVAEGEESDEDLVDRTRARVQPLVTAGLPTPPKIDSP